MEKVFKSISLVLASLIIFSFVACGKSADLSESKTDQQTTIQPTEEPKEKAKIKVVLMTGDDARKAINSKYLSAENFSNDLKDIEVEIEELNGGDDYTNKLKAYNAAGELPDVFFSQGTSLLYPMISASTVLDLLPEINNDGFSEKYAEKAAITPWTDGKLYALQAGSDMYFIPRIFYNKDIFEKNGIKIPKTYNEFLSVCKTLKSKGFIPWATYGKDGWAIVNYLYQNFVMAENPDVILDLIANKTNFSNPASMNALAKIQEMAQNGVFQPGVATMEYGAVKELFTSKKAAMYSMMTWELPGLAADTNVDIMDFPQINTSIDMSKTVQFWGGPNSGYCVSSSTTEKESAVMVAEYCATQEAKYFNIEQKAPTALNTGIAVEAGSNLMVKNLDNFKNATKKVQSLSLYAFGAKFSPEFGMNGAKLLTGKYSPEDFVKAIEPMWKENFNN